MAEGDAEESKPCDFTSFQQGFLRDLIHLEGLRLTTKYHKALRRSGRLLSFDQVRSTRVVSCHHYRILESGIYSFSLQHGAVLLGKKKSWTTEERWKMEWRIQQWRQLANHWCVHSETNAST